MNRSLCRGFAFSLQLKVALPAALLVLLCLFPVNIQAHESQHEILVGSELDYPPYATVDENGNADGYSVDLFKAVAEQIGIKVRFVVGPWDEVKGKLERGDIDALPLVAYSKEREQYFDFGQPHIISHAVAFVRKGQNEFSSINDLRGKEVIVMRSDSTHEYVLFSNMTDNITLTNTVGEAFELLASGQHDFVIAPKLSGLILLKELGIENIEPFGEPLETYDKGYSFAVREGNADLLEHLDRGLALVQASGEYDRIYDKWFGHLEPQQTDYDQFVWRIAIAATIIGLLIVLGFIWNMLLRRQVAAKTASLMESEKRFEATFAETAIGMAHVAPDGSWLRVNQALCKMVGYSEKELLQLTFQDITHPDDLDVDLHFVGQVLAGEIDHYSMEKRYIHKDGSVIWIHLTVSLVWKENGEPDYFISAVENISDRKQLHNQMIEQRNQAQQYLDVAAVMLVALDASGAVTLINRKGLEILGYREDELIGKNWFETCLPKEVVSQMHDVFDQSMSGDLEPVAYFENEIITKSGEHRLIAFHNTLLKNRSGEIAGVLSSGEDITERQAAADNLKKMSRAIEQAGEAVVITDADATIEYLNPAFERITGYSREEMIGQNPRILQSGKHDRAFYKQMWARLTSGKVWQGRLIDKRKDGSLYPVLVTISPLKNNEGDITHYVGVQQSLKKYEDLETQFHQAQKMEAIGTLVGGIAHDFNNTLAGITSNLYLAKLKVKQPDVREKVENAEKLSFSAAATIQQLLTFSRKGVVNMSKVPIASFLKEVIKLHRVSIPENITIIEEIESSDMSIEGDINQLQQVVLNLMNNARDALEKTENPQIILKLTREVVESENEMRMKAGEYACIAVIDNGCGISADEHEHIFEPFFTTKEPGKGTGLGLSMVYGAVKTHGGWVFAEPGIDGTGTAMKIYLPLQLSGKESKHGQLSDEVIMGKGETILLVDDNQMVLDVGKEVLEGLNYRVLTAMDGVDAVGLYSDKQSGIDLLVLDVVMPRLGGLEALKEIRDMNPDVKALFATGYNKAATIMDSHEFQSEIIIAKPFAVSELSQLIRQKLDS